VLIAAMEVRSNIGAEGDDFALKAKCFVLIEKIKISSVIILSINQTVLKTSAPCFENMAKTVRSKIVLTIPKNVAVITISELL